MVLLLAAAQATWAEVVAPHKVFSCHAEEAV